MARRDEGATGLAQRNRVKTDVFLAEDGSLVDASGNAVGLTGAQSTATQTLVSGSWTVASILAFIASVPGTLLQLLLRSLIGGYSPWAVLSRSLVSVPHTGTTSATQILSITIPGGTLGPNGMFRLWLLTSETNNANNKTLIVRMSGTAFYQAGDSSKTGRELIICGGNAGATGSQKLGFTGRGSVSGASTGTLVTSSFDTTADQTIQIVVTLANAADTFTLEGHQLEVAYGA